MCKCFSTDAIRLLWDFRFPAHQAITVKSPPLKALVEMRQFAMQVRTCFEACILQGLRKTLKSTKDSTELTCERCLVSLTNMNMLTTPHVLYRF